MVDPLDPSDDTAIGIRAKAHPGDAKVYIKFTRHPEHQFVGFFRSEGTDGPYTFLDQIANPATSIYTDTTAVNDTTYCYKAAAVDFANRRTATSAPTCTTPHGDPFPPHGYVLINGNAAKTLTPDVELTLWATDQVDPESELPSDDILLADEVMSGVVEMRISNHADTSGSSWEPYATTNAWNLGQSDGLAAVFVQYRDAAGNESDVAQATIYVGVEPDEPADDDPNDDPNDDTPNDSGSIFLPLIQKE